MCEILRKGNILFSNFEMKRTREKGRRALESVRTIVIIILSDPNAKNE